MEITFDLNIWQVVQLFVLPVLLPLLVGLVTTRVTHSGIKAVLLLGLSVITALITEMLASQVAGTSYNLGMGLLTAFITFVFGVGVHTGLLKPTGATEKVQEIGSHKVD